MPLQSFDFSWLFYLFIIIIIIIILLNLLRPYERATLNERPIYIHTYHITLAVVQSVIHLYYDYDRIPIPVAKRDPEGKDQRTHPLEPVIQSLRNTMPEMLTVFKRTSMITMSFPVVYTLFLRRPAWSFTLYFAKLFWNFARSAAKPPGFFPGVGVGAFLQSFVSGTLLVFCWEITNALFTIFLGQEPLKRGQPLTAEAKDPNGSLLNGLKAKKEVVNSFAFWELCFISQRFPDRRKAIFNDIDREGGAAWSQIRDASVELIQGISTRISESKQDKSKPSSQTIRKPQPEIHTLPRLADPPKKDNIFAASPKATSRPAQFAETIGTTAKSYGQSSDWTPVARARVRDAFGRASSAVLSPERKQKLLASSREFRLLTGPTPKTGPETIHPFIVQFLRSPVGQPLRQTYAQRLRSIVLGRPHASLCPLVDAIESLTRLLVASVTEDMFGKVCADVPTVVCLFTKTITDLEPFINGGLGIHWTDVTFPPSSDPQAQAAARRVPEVDLVLAVLKSSLADLVAAFSKHARDFGLGEKDLRLARKAAGIEERKES